MGEDAVGAEGTAGEEPWPAMPPSSVELYVLTTVCFMSAPVLMRSSAKVGLPVDDGTSPHVWAPLGALEKSMQNPAVELVSGSLQHCEPAGQSKACTFRS